MKTQGQPLGSWTRNKNKNLKTATYHRKDSADQVQVSYKIQNKAFCQWKKLKYRGASKYYPKCPVFNKKLQDMQINRKQDPYSGQKKNSEKKIN